MRNDPTGGEPSGSGQDHQSSPTTPPILKEYSDVPQYDLATMVQQIGIRAITLWTWEQQLHVPQPVNVNDDAGIAARSYSERDLVACTWVRDQVLLGYTPAEAADLLLRAQPPPSDDPARGAAAARGDTGAGMARPPVNSRPLGQAATAWNRSAERQSGELTAAQGNSGSLPRSAPPSGPLRVAPPSGPLRSAPPSGPLRAAPPSGPLRPASHIGMLTGPATTGVPVPAQPVYPPYPSSASRPSSPALPPGMPAGGPRPAPYAMPANGSGYLMPVPPLANQPGASVSMPAPWASQSMPVPAVIPGRDSGALRARASGTLMRGDQRMSGSSGQWSVAPPAPVGRELRSLVQPLLRAFVTFDTPLANRLVEEALSARALEAVCAGLFIPALNRVSDLWGRNELSIPEERFATNYVRGILFSYFATTPERADGPLTVVTCGPREVSDLNALMLATFWRRAGIRVVFLGQDVDGQALVHDVRMRRPNLVCVAITSTQRLRALARISKSVVQMESPTPIFTYSGSPFARNPELQRKIAGVYLGDDPATATWHAMRLLSVNARGAPPTNPGNGMGQAG